jgi:hypothetical protein
MSTVNKTYSGFIRWSFEMPNTPYSQRYQQLYQFTIIKSAIFEFYNFSKYLRVLNNKFIVYEAVIISYFKSCIRNAFLKLL